MTFAGALIGILSESCSSSSLSSWSSASLSNFKSNKATLKSETFSFGIFAWPE